MASEAQDMDTLERIKLEITERLEEIRPVAQEVTELEAALNALGGATTTPRRVAPKPKDTSTSTKARGNPTATKEYWERHRVERMKELITFVMGHGLESGFTIREVTPLFNKWGVNPGNARRSLFDFMIERGLVEETGRQIAGSHGGYPAKEYRLIKTEIVDQ